jgi:hypothetical protein
MAASQWSSHKHAFRDVNQSGHRKLIEYVYSYSDTLQVLLVSLVRWLIVSCHKWLSKIRNSVTTVGWLWTRLSSCRTLCFMDRTECTPLGKGERETERSNCTACYSSKWEDAVYGKDIVSVKVGSQLLRNCRGSILCRQSRVPGCFDNTDFTWPDYSHSHLVSPCLLLNLVGWEITRQGLFNVPKFWNICETDCLNM